MAKRRFKKTTWEVMKKVADRNAIFLEEEPDRFIEEDVRAYQMAIFEALRDMIGVLETDSNGRLVNSRKNIQGIANIGRELKYLGIQNGSQLINSYLKTVNTVLKNNFELFTVIVYNNEEFRDTRKQIVDEVNVRLGINDQGNLRKDGYLDQILNEGSTFSTITENLFSSAYSNAYLKDVISDARAYLNGHKNTKGAVEAFYSQHLMRESFGEIDRIASATFARKYGLTKFFYAGTLIKTSRAFCRHKIHGLYTIEEARQWINENPKPIVANPDSYNPIIQMGGFNCRHCPVFVTDEMAYQMKSSLSQ